MLNPTRPYFYLMAYIAVLYLRPQEYVPAIMGFPLIPVLLGFAFAFWLFAQRKDFGAPQFGLLAGLVVIMFVSVARADGVASAVAMVKDFAPTVMVFLVAATSIDSMVRFKQISWLLSGLIAVIAFHGADQAASEDGTGWTGARMVEGRITYLGYLNDPNDLAMAFLMVLPLTVFSARRESRLPVRVMLYAVAALILYGIFLCNSRGSMLGVLAMAVMYGVRRFGWFRGAVVTPIAMSVMLLFAPSRVSEMSADEESAAGRIDAWYEGFEMLREHPFIGVGKGLFTDHNYLTAHNSFVLAIAEVGLFGYFFWLSILIVSAIMLARLMHPKPPANEGEEPMALAPIQGLDGVDAESSIDARRAGQSGDEPTWSEVNAAAVALAYSLLGTMVAAFFLSRTYVNILYLLIAMIMAVYAMARRRWPVIAPVEPGSMFGRLMAAEFGSIVFLWALTRILLALG